MIGAEARTKGIEMVYGPTVNIVREPQWGRAFESLGEDPDLAGTIGAAEVEGIQRTGVMAQVKHYAVYTQETNRLVPADDAVLSTKALHEIYLRPFTQIVAAAKPASIMCAYGEVGGVGNCEDRSLIAGYLDSTLHYTGFVGSDYHATMSTAGTLAAGLDQEQPESTQFGSALVAAVEAGRSREPRSTRPHCGCSRRWTASSLVARSSRAERCARPRLDPGRPLGGRAGVRGGHHAC